MRRRIVAVAIACMATACAGDESTPTHAHDERAADSVDPPPTPVPDPVPEPGPDPAKQRAAQTEALLVTVEALAEVHDRHASDCSALADAIVQFHAKHGAALAEAPAELHATIDANEALRARMRAAMESVMSASMACRGDPRFTAVTAELFGD